MKILVFLAEGFEEVEALTVVDYTRRMGIEADMVSVEGNKEVAGAHGIKVLADLAMDDVALENYEGLVIPGGLPGAANLRDNARVVDLVKDMNERGKLLAAICAGPIVLARAGIIENKKITSYPGFEKDLQSGQYENSPAVLDGNMITARGPYYAVDFALEIVRYLLGEEKAEELKKNILYKEK